jgi:hypothetical protein
MKVRVLYPLAFGPYLKAEPEGGRVVDIDDNVALALIGEGFAERVDTKPVIEQATAAPGEKRPTRQPTRKKS